MKMIDTEITLSFNPHKVKENFLKNLLDFSKKTEFFQKIPQSLNEENEFDEIISSI